jgi:hypothetical protein
MSARFDPDRREVCMMLSCEGGTDQAANQPRRSGYFMRAHAALSIAEIT